MRKIGKCLMLTGVAMAFLLFALLFDLTFGKAVFAHAENLPSPEFRITEGSLEQVYGSYTPVSGAFYGADGQKLADCTPQFTFDGTYPAKGEYSLVAKYAGSAQYAATEKQLTLKITPRPVNIQVTGSYDFTYDGMPHTRTWAIDGVLQNEDPGLKLLYNSLESPVDVGTYEITMRVSNPNYKVGVISGGAGMRINPRNLTISMDSVVVREGETPEYKFHYSGFVSGEDEKVLTVLPTVSGVSSEPGVYQLLPTGAEAKNYSISYSTASLTVNRKQIETDGEADLPIAKLEGTFSPNAYAVLSAGDVASDSFLRAQGKLRSGKLISKLKVDGYYVLDVSEDRVGQEFLVSLSNQKLSPIASHHIAVVDKQGNLYRVEGYRYRGNTLTFRAPTDGEIIIYRDYTVFICVIVGVAFVIFAVIAFRIAERYRFKRSKFKAENQPKKQKPKYIW